MKAVNSGKSKWLNSPLILSLCLVLVCLITTGAIGCSANGKAPNIKLFETDNIHLHSDDWQMYTVVVTGATEIFVTENGGGIWQVKSPNPATFKGKVKGLPANAIQIGGSSTFDVVLKARNGNIEVERTLTLPFANELPPPPASLIPPVSGTKDRPPKWGDPYSSPRPTQPTTSTATQLPWPPEFAQCTSDCPYCLTPDKAKSRGFTQKCLDQPCYYPPDNQKKWYCYSEPEGWCCKNTQVSQSTKTECTQIGGYWSTDQSQAMQACQPMCWCCVNGQVGQVPQAQCAQMGGTCYANYTQAMQACQQMTACWCCVNGQVVQLPQAQCLQMGGCCHNTQAEAVRECQGGAAPPTAPPPYR